MCSHLALGEHKVVELTAQLELRQPVLRDWWRDNRAGRTMTDPGGGWPPPKNLQRLGAHRIQLEQNTARAARPSRGPSIAKAQLSRGALEIMSQ
jgi:hypothetical protein